MAHDVDKNRDSKAVQTLNNTREIETSFTSATVFVLNLCTFKLHVGRHNGEHREGVYVLRPLLQPLDGRGYICFNRIRCFEGKPRRHEIPSECSSPGGGKNFTS